MLRKWEWIKAQCLMREFGELAKMAEEIDSILVKNYDVEHTPQWIAYNQATKMNSDPVSYWVLVGIVSDPRFCIACVASAGNCRGCQFAKLSGECGDENSLFGRFFRELERVWHHGQKRMLLGDEIENFNGGIE